MPSGLPPGPDGPPDIHVAIENIIVEGDRVVDRNRRRAADFQAQQKMQFGGLVIWRIVDGKLAEQWAHLASHPVH